MGLVVVAPAGPGFLCTLKSWRILIGHNNNNKNLLSYCQAAMLKKNNARVVFWQGPANNSREPQHSGNPASKVRMLTYLTADSDAFARLLVLSFCNTVLAGPTPTQKQFGNDGA
jgi:hypothetical protein